MATIRQVIQYVDDVKPNAFSNATKVEWINEAEGLVQTEVLLRVIDEVETYAWETDADTELLARPPHDKLYRAYLVAMVDFANGEYNRYNNTLAMFNAHFGEFQRWFAHVYRPADTHGEVYADAGTLIDTEWRGYYITAYGIAVKHGYKGTEADWLEGLRGERGPRGYAPVLRYDGETDTLQRYDDETAEWIPFMTGAEIRGAELDEAVAAAQSAQAAATSAKTEAQRAAERSGGYAEASQAVVLQAFGHEVSSETDNPVVITDALAGWDVRGIHVTVEPELDGTGDPSPSNIREITNVTPAVTMRGRNILQMVTGTSTSYGVTFKKNADGSIDLSGTATGGHGYVNVKYTNGTLLIPKNTQLKRSLTLDGSAAPTGVSLRIYYNTENDADSQYWTDFTDGVFTLTDPAGDTLKTTWGRIWVTNGTNVDGVKIWPMIYATAEGSAPDTTYFDPYRNKTWTAELPESVHGGTVEIRTGVLTKTWETVTYDGTEEGWALSSSTYKRFAIDVPKPLEAFDGTAAGFKGLCNIFATGTIDSTNTPMNSWWYFNTGAAKIYFFWDYTAWTGAGSTALEKWKAFLASMAAAETPLTICVPLATAETAQIDMQAMEPMLHWNRFETNAEELTVDYFAEGAGTSAPPRPIDWPQVDDTLTQPGLAADAKKTGQELRKLKAIKTGTAFAADRIFRRVNEAEDGKPRYGGQSICATPNGFVIMGSVDGSTYETQRLTEFSTVGEELVGRHRTYTTSASYNLHHANGCCYDPDKNKIYVAGLQQVVVIDYATLDVDETHDIGTAITGIAYDDGTLYGKSGSSIFTIDLSSDTVTQIATATVQGYSDLVGQDMDVHGGYAYLVFNLTNQLLKVDLETGETVESIIVGEGNGRYPYGEIESVTFKNGQMYMLSGIFFAGRTTSAELTNYGFIQVFRTNIGGSITVHTSTGQGFAGSAVTQVNKAGTDSSSMNPTGGSDAPFLRVCEACVHIMYNSANSWGRSYRLQVNGGNSHDYSKDILLLKNVDCVIDLGGQTLPLGELRNGTYFIQNGAISGTLTLNGCVCRLENVTVGTISAEDSRIIMGTGASAGSTSLTRSGIEWDAPGSVLALGDSICAGQRNGGKGYIGDLGIPYTNAGVSGARLSRTASSDTYWTESQLPGSGNFDAAVICGGANDYYNNVPLGTLSSAPATYDSAAWNALDLTTVLGALEHLFAKVIHTFPNTDRYFVITHKTKKYTNGHQWYWPTTPNTAGGYTQEDMHDAIVRCCEMYNVQVIDVYKESAMNTGFAEYVSDTAWTSGNSAALETAKQWADSDGVHPLAWGYKHGYLPLIRKALLGGSRKG